MANGVEPALKGKAAAEPRGLSRECQEGSLENVLGCVTVGQLTAGNAQNHPPVPVQQLGERRLVAQADEAVKQLGITGRNRRAGPGTKVGEYPRQGRDPCAHGVVS
jgi:hypothetical protein